MIITVDNLIAEVRSMLDEVNRVSVDDDQDILPALNRGQSYAANILARHYESPMLLPLEIPTVGGQPEYAIPENAFEQRLEKLEVKVNGIYEEVTRINYRDISSYESQTSSAFPRVYVVVNEKFRILPKPTGTYPLRAWILEQPQKLVKTEGRINIVNTAGNYVILDSVGTGLTTESDNLDSFVNIIDAQTGRRKATFQVQSINGNIVTFKTVPTRTDVLNITIDTDITDLVINQNSEGPAMSVNPDDYICLVHGSCVPFFKQPFSNFTVEYAIAEIRRKLGDSDSDEQRVLDKLEKQVERSWVGQEQYLRIKNRNPRWNYSLRRRW